MITRRQVRTFTLLVSTSQRFDEACKILGNPQNSQAHALAEILGMTARDAQIDDIGLLPEDYKPLQDLTGSNAIGKKLVEVAMLNPVTRVRARHLVTVALRKNRKATLPPIINASRVADALITYALDAAEVDFTAPLAKDSLIETVPPPSPSPSPSPSTVEQFPAGSWQRRFAPYNMQLSSHPAHKAFIEPASQPVTPEKAAKNATTVAPRGARRNARKTA